MYISITYDLSVFTTWENLPPFLWATHFLGTDHKILHWRPRYRPQVYLYCSSWSREWKIYWKSPPWCHSGIFILTYSQHDSSFHLLPDINISPLINGNTLIPFPKPKSSGSFSIPSSPFPDRTHQSPSLVISIFSNSKIILFFSIPKEAVLVEALYLLRCQVSFGKMGPPNARRADGPGTESDSASWGLSRSRFFLYCCTFIIHGFRFDSTTISTFQLAVGEKEGWRNLSGADHCCLHILARTWSPAFNYIWDIIVYV